MRRSCRLFQALLMNIHASGVKTNIVTYYVLSNYFSAAKARLNTNVLFTSIAINLQSYPVYGIYQPDAIKYFTFNGVDYIITANEGDSKDMDSFSEEDRVKDLDLSSNFGMLISDFLLLFLENTYK